MILQCPVSHALKEELLESDGGNEKFPLGNILLAVLEGHSGEAGHEIVYSML